MEPVNIDLLKDIIRISFMDLTKNVKEEDLKSLPDLFELLAVDMSHGENDLQLLLNNGTYHNVRTKYIKKLTSLFKLFDSLYDKYKHDIVTNKDAVSTILSKCKSHNDSYASAIVDINSNNITVPEAIKAHNLTRYLYTLNSWIETFELVYIKYITLYKATKQPQVCPKQLDLALTPSTAEKINPYDALECIRLSLNKSEENSREIVKLNKELTDKKQLINEAVASMKVLLMHAESAKDIVDKLTQEL